MAKASKREWAWLQCTECNDLNYRVEINMSLGMPERLKEGLRKYCKRMRRHSVHKVKRK